MMDHWSKTISSLFVRFAIVAAKVQNTNNNFKINNIVESNNLSNIKSKYRF